MNLKVFAIYDKGAMCYGFPFFVRASGEAARSFTEAVNDPKSQFYKHPQDFALWELGLFDDQTGYIVTLEHGPREIMSGLTVKQEAEGG